MESKEQVYKNQVKKKIDELAKICYQNNMPCCFVVAVGDKALAKGEERNEHDKLELKITSYIPETMNVDTTDTVFSDIINVTNGFTTQPPTDRSVFALEAGDLELSPDLEI